MSSPRLPLSSRPTFLPDEISRREFATVFRGYDPAEVRTFLNQLSEQSADLADRVAEIQKALVETEERVKNPELTEEMVTSLLGEQTAQILRSAREAAAETRRKTDEEIGRSLRDAHEVTTKMREEAETLLRERTEEAEKLAETSRAETDEYATTTRNDVRAEAERARAELNAEIIRRREQAEREINEERVHARQEARDIIDTARMESQTLIERTQDRQTELIEGLVRLRKIALAQLDSLRAGRARLLGAYKMVRSTLDDVTIELEKVEEEARRAGMAAGAKAAEDAALETAELDQVIEMEDFEVDDDVPQEVINLVESGQHVVPSWGGSEDITGLPEGVGTDAPFDLATASYEDGRSGNGDNVVRLGVIDGDAGSGRAPATDNSTVATMVRKVEEQQTLEVVVDSDEDDYDDDEDNEVDTFSQPTLVIGDSDGDDAERALKLRRDAVVGKARSQATRRLKRAMQDEQDGLTARLRSGEFKSIQALLGSPDDQAAAYHRAVVKLLREVVRTGATSVPGSTGVERGTVDRTGTASARALADQVVADLRERVVPLLDNMLNEAEAPDGDTINSQLAAPYAYMKGDYLDQVVADRVGQVFDEGVQLAR